MAVRGKEDEEGEEQREKKDRGGGEGRKEV